MARIQCKPNPALKRFRAFTTSAIVHTHYKTLNVPLNASKGQIKSSYFQLSKTFHPDLTKDPNAKDKFHEISEAYKVLSDDRQRRAYDRSLASAQQTRTSHPTHPHQNHRAYDPGRWGYETRRWGATYAWETSHPHSRPRHSHPNREHPQSNPKSSTSSYGAGGPYNTGNPYNHPFTDGSAFGFRSSQYYRPHQSAQYRRQFEEERRVANVSMFWRSVQIFGIVFFVGLLGGGWTANAG